MKKSLIALSLIAVILVLPVLALAQPAGNITLEGLIAKIKNIVWQVFGLIAVISFVVAGILFLTAAGNPEKISAARSAFMWGFAGVIVGIIAFGIIALVQGLIF